MKIIIGDCTFETYDPRLGEEFKYRTFTRPEDYSNLAVPFYALTASWSGGWFRREVPMFEIEPLARFVQKTIRRLDGIGFYTLNLLTRKMKKAHVLDMKTVDEYAGSVIGYFDSAEAQNGIFNAQSKHLEYEIWCIGCCSSKFKEPNRKHKWYEESYDFWDVDNLLLQHEKIKCIFCYPTEANFAFFLTRLFDDLDTLVEEMLAELRSAQSP